MSWVKFDDKFNLHPKVIAAGPLAVTLHMRAIVYCGQYLTDGRVRRRALSYIMQWADDAEDFGGPVPDNRTLAARLVNAGLWDESPDGDGWVVHDYLEYNPSRDEVEQGAAVRAESARRAGFASGAARRATRERNANETRTERSASVPDPFERNANGTRTERSGSVQLRSELSELSTGYPQPDERSDVDTSADSGGDIQNVDIENIKESNGTRTARSASVRDPFERNANGNEPRPVPVPVQNSERVTRSRAHAHTRAGQELPHAQATGEGLGLAELADAGFGRFGMLGGTAVAKLARLAPVAAWEWKAVLDTDGKSWPYAAKVLESMREESAKGKAPAAAARNGKSKFLDGLRTAMQGEDHAGQGNEQGGVHATDGQAKELLSEPDR